MSVNISHLYKRYGSAQILNDVSFSVDSGEIVGFIGPNGAGKSTIMKCITGFIPFDSGDVCVCGVSVASDPIEAKRLIGYLPEHNPLYLDMYVKEYLQFVGGIYGLGAKTARRVDELIGIVGLQNDYQKKINQLSKGYRQRVGLAQALIHDPQVLILDEPTTGLDPNQLVEVRSLIHEIGRTKTVMLSTHIMQEVSAICDRVVIINHGRIVADKSEQDIVKTENFDIVLETSSPLNVGLITHMHDVISAESDGNVVNIVASSDIRAELFRTVVGQNLTIVTLTLKSKNMEDVFHDITHN